MSVHSPKQGIQGCEVCARLEAQERRLRSAYDSALKLIDSLGDAPAINRYETVRELADNIWEMLESIMQDLKEHRQNHR